MRTLLIASLALATFGCGSAPSPVSRSTNLQPTPETPPLLCESKPYSDEDLHQAALNVIFPKLHYYGSNIPSLESLRVQQSKLAALYVWANGLENIKIRNAYLAWLDSYKKDYDEIEENIKHPVVSTKEQDDERERQERTARAIALQRCLPKP